MQEFLATIERLSGFAPEALVHAPFAHKLNVTPYASLTPSLPYDPAACAGKHAVLFATPDKTETLDLWARIVAARPRSLTIFWPNDWGGKSMGKLLQGLSADAVATAKHHARIAFLQNPLADPKWVTEAKAVPGTELKAEPGLFSWRAVDPASALLAKHLPHDIKGRVADFGCGWGYLSSVLLTNPDIKTLHAIDNDIRAVNRTRANLPDTRLETRHADITTWQNRGAYDVVVMNPPFHAQGSETRKLGIAFIEKAAESLTKRGVLYLVANRHLPYEHTLRALFAQTTVLADENGYKVIMAIKGD